MWFFPEKTCGFEKSLSSKTPPLNLCEYLLISKKIKKLIRANIDKKLDSIVSVPINFFPYYFS